MYKNEKRKDLNEAKEEKVTDVEKRSWMWNDEWKQSFNESRREKLRNRNGQFKARRRKRN